MNFLFLVLPFHIYVALSPFQPIPSLVKVANDKKMITNVRGVESIIDAWDGDVNIKSVLVLYCIKMMQRMILMITYIYEADRDKVRQRGSGAES